MLLLDTCTLLWLVDDHSQLSSSAVDLLRANAEALYVSAISGFEIGQKHVTGRLRLPSAPGQWFGRALELHGITELPVTSGLAVAATELPRLHKDPADRIIIATAMASGLAVLTPDRLIAAYPGVVVQW